MCATESSECDGILSWRPWNVIRGLLQFSWQGKQVVTDPMQYILLETKFQYIIVIIIYISFHRKPYKIYIKFLGAYKWRLHQCILTGQFRFTVYVTDSNWTLFILSLIYALFVSVTDIWYIHTYIFPYIHLQEIHRKDVEIVTINTDAECLLNYVCHNNTNISKFT